MSEELGYRKLVPEVGIPSSSSGQAHRHGVKALLKAQNPRDSKIGAGGRNRTDMSLRLAGF